MLRNLGSHKWRRPCFLVGYSFLNPHFNDKHDARRTVVRTDGPSAREARRAQSVRLWGFGFSLRVGTTIGRVLVDFSIESPGGSQNLVLSSASAKSLRVFVRTFTLFWQFLGLRNQTGTRPQHGSPLDRFSIILDQFF